MAETWKRPDIKRGARIGHANGGPPMTVLRNSWDVCGEIVKCFWLYDDGTRGCAWFPVRHLVEIDVVVGGAAHEIREHAERRRKEQGE